MAEDTKPAPIVAAAQRDETPKAPKVIYWLVDLGSKGTFAPGEEEEMAKHVTPEQVAELKTLGAISGDWN